MAKARRNEEEKENILCSREIKRVRQFTSEKQKLRNEQKKRMHAKIKTC